MNYKKKTMAFAFIIFLLISHQTIARDKKPPTYFPITEHGKMIPWEKVKTLLPIGKKFEVIDFETGFHFMVQRRAGDKHADVQPLTYKDTAIMKHVFNGKWSWKRRAIIIPAKGKMIAASMHGMPHGAGALANGFPGHFCIHFPGSTTHRTKNEDPSHQLMIIKAAGKLNDYAQKATPKQVVNLFLVGIKQGDERFILPALKNQKLKRSYLSITKDISAIQYKIRTDGIRPSFVVKTEIPVEASIYWSERGNEKTDLLFTVERLSLTDPWKISNIEFGQSKSKKE
ncbi:hypothetical protein WD019_10915 [Fictibacillus sp. Mic-4]|uniref:hypothetical protein n=1 Tax=Fictibacillus sp. Mic-4 TaxID=3132826 RepID=UPI003CE833D4